MFLKNYMEEIVVQAFEDYLRENPDFCRCPRCYRDVLAITLNQLQSRYVGSEEGEIRSRVAQSDRQVKADVTVALMKAVDIVRSRPHHEKEKKA